MKHPLLLALAALVGSLCIACTPQAQPTTDTQPTSAPQAIGMANPASVFCIKQGGTLEIVQIQGGEQSLCHLPDGRVVEEWALFRASQAANPTSPTQPQ